MHVTRTPHRWCWIIDAILINNQCQAKCFGSDLGHHIWLVSFVGKPGCCMSDVVGPAQHQLPQQRHPAGSIGVSRGSAEHAPSSEAAQQPAAASSAPNGATPSRGRRRPSRGQRPPVGSAAAAAERALADLRPHSDRAQNQAASQAGRRPPRAASRLQASAAPFVPDDAGAPGQRQEGYDPQRGGQPRPHRHGGQPAHAANGPVDAALSVAQASAARALGVAGQQPQRRRRQRPGRGGGSRARTDQAQSDAAPLADGSDSAAQTSDDLGDDNSCPICTEPLVVCSRAASISCYTAAMACDK